MSCRNPLCDSTEPDKLTKGLCPACYAYRHRTGRQRDPRRTRGGRGRAAPIPNLDALARRYLDGETIAALAAEAGCKPSTLATNLQRAGARKRVWLADEDVRRARYRHQHGGESMEQIAADMGVSYNTMWNILSGHTRRAAGGPIPLPKKERLCPCARCRALTTTILCPFCLEEGHLEKDYAVQPRGLAAGVVVCSPTPGRAKSAGIRRRNERAQDG
jgi:lambda repressor-like predicted transcriptional regulator